MGLLDSVSQLSQSRDVPREAAKQLETMVLKQVLSASGAFRGSQAAGSSMWSDLLAESVAAAVTSRGGLGLADSISAQLGAAPAAPAAADLGALLAGPSTVTSTFGQRVDPLTHQPTEHEGVDLGAAEGTPILAAMDGVVLQAGPRGGYGNAVELGHADGTTTLYAHAATVGVQVGQKVRAGDPLAAVGSTGRSTGPHLHFELRSAGKQVDPRVALQRYGRRDETDHGDRPHRWETP
jgi:murein DD-endopeptidase MepM/ murein hydrolase activator NlpD